MNNDFEVKAEEVELFEGTIEALAEEEQEETGGGPASVCKTNCYHMSFSGYGANISNVRLVANAVGARCTWTTNYIQIIRPAGRKGSCTVQYNFRGKTHRQTIRFQ